MQWDEMRSQVDGVTFDDVSGKVRWEIGNHHKFKFRNLY
jgi:hypothetical protein